MQHWSAVDKEGALRAALNKGAVLLIVDLTAKRLALPARGVFANFIVHAEGAPNTLPAELLPLRVSYRYEQIDLKLVSATGVEATFSFNNSTIWHRCKLPWSSIISMIDAFGKDLSRLPPKSRLV